MIHSLCHPLFIPLVYESNIKKVRSQMFKEREITASVWSDTYCPPPPGKVWRASRPYGYGLVLDWSHTSQNFGFISKQDGWMEGCWLSTPESTSSNSAVGKNVLSNLESVINCRSCIPLTSSSKRVNRNAYSLGLNFEPDQTKRIFYLH